MARAKDEQAVDRRALAVTALFATAQDALYALVFLSYMNAYLLEELHASPALPGYTLALYGGMKLAVHPLSGRLLDRTSPRLVLFLAAAVQGAGTALLLASHTLAAFLGATVLLAAGSASMWPLIYETTARTQRPRARSAASGTLALVGYLGTGAGFAAGVVTARFAPWRTAFVLAAGVVAAPLVVAGARALQRRSGAAAEREASPEPSAGGRRLAAIGVVLFLDYAAISSLAGVYGPYTHVSLGLNLLTTTLLLLPAGAAAVGALYVTSRWSRPERRFREMAALYLLAGSGALALAFTRAPWLAAVLAVPLAAGAGGIGPIVAATMMDVSGTAARGFVLGSLMSVEGTGSVVGPGVVALVVEVTSPRGGVAAIGVVFFALALLTGLGYRRLRPVAPASAPQMGENPD